MKTFVKVFLLLVLLVILASAVFASPATPGIKSKDTVSVTLTPTHYKDLLILKADKTYVGASVNIHDGTGAVVSSGHLHKKKMIIDFYDIPSGTYTICVAKDKATVEFTYTKKYDSEMLN